MTASKPNSLMQDLAFSQLSESITQAVRLVPGGAKRRASKDPIQKWYPYYAGYSLEFAESVLQAARLERASCVFDPWNGSGTTTLAAARLGLRGVGFDLNPVAAIVARARLVNSSDALGVCGFVRELGSAVFETEPSPQDRLLDWLPAETARAFRHFQWRVLKNFASPEANSPLGISEDRFPPLAAFLLLALTRAAKTSVARRMTSNPAVFRKGPSTDEAGTTLAERWLIAVTDMARELPQVPMTPVEPSVFVRDSRTSSPDSGSVDFTLSSPPYCTRLDYGDTTNFELAAFGPTTGDGFDALRRSLMGAPLVRSRERPEIPSAWPSSVKELLESVRTHPSKASDSYYYKTYWQYFDDAMKSLANVREALKPRCFAALVVQSSYYKDVRVDLPELYVDMAKAVGFESLTAHKTPVRTVISAIHPGTKTYRSTWDYSESVVLLRKE